MTIKQLKEELDKFPDDMPVTTHFSIDWTLKDDPHCIEVKQTTWVHSNHPYDAKDFEYVNLL